jgi:hypothetical protein
MASHYRLPREFGDSLITVLFSALIYSTSDY